MKRRRALGALAAAAASSTLPWQDAEAFAPARGAAGRLKQSVSRWCYGKLSLDALCAAAKDIGLVAIDLLDQQDWMTPRKYGLACAMANGFGSIPRGFNRLENHDQLVADAEKMIPAAAAANVPNIVCFSGNRAGLSDEEGITNCITGFRRITPLAERAGVTLCLELLNSKVDHKDYQADHSGWGVRVVQGVGSPRLRLLYDIYHMQIMEGDVIRTIRDHAAVHRTFPHGRRARPQRDR